MQVATFDALAAVLAPVEFLDSPFFEAPELAHVLASCRRALAMHVSPTLGTDPDNCVVQIGARTAAQHDGVVNPVFLQGAKPDEIGIANAPVSKQAFNVVRYAPTHHVHDCIVIWDANDPFAAGLPQGEGWRTFGAAIRPDVVVLGTLPYAEGRLARLNQKQMPEYGRNHSARRFRSGDDGSHQIFRAADSFGESFAVFQQYPIGLI